MMDEFHWYADRDRGVAWQVPLLTLPHTRFLLMSATLGDTRFFEEALTALNGRPTAEHQVDRPPGAARLRLRRDPAGPHPREARGGGQDACLRRPLHAGRRGRQRPGLHEPEDLHAGREGGHRVRHRRLRASPAPTAPRSASGCGTASACTTRGCCPSTGCSSSSSRSRACSRSSAAPTRSASASTCPSAPCCSRGSASSTGGRRPSSSARDFHQIAGPRRPQGVRRPRLRRGAGARARHREHQARREGGPRRQEGRRSAGRPSTTSSTGT